ncbi:MAG: hypothetical protein ACKVU1_17260 [bacterium]
MRFHPGIALAATIAATAWAATTAIDSDPHGNPASGVLRITTDPPSRGECQQCHPTHGDELNISGFPPVLFDENANAIAFFLEGDGPCHPGMPINYPLGESDRIPETEPGAGYFEANSGGTRLVGVELRGRWPGEAVYTNSEATAEGRLISPHAFDPDMPRRDAGGEGLCLNCHDPHDTPGQRDLLLARYDGIGGYQTVGPPPEYRFCFTCHGADGAPGMEIENRYIEDYYDAALNGEFAGHQIRKNPDIALSWPSNVRVGDRLPCYDCHNPHGSRGNNGVEPNAFLISDQRPGWSGLTNTLDDAAQARRFCLGCHIPSDGIPGSQTVEGIVMNTLPDEDEHMSTATESCHDCHGRDYSSPTGKNVHNPSEGDV